jgi:hypothetical protein
VAAAPRLREFKVSTSRGTEEDASDVADALLRPGAAPALRSLDVSFGLRAPSSCAPMAAALRHNTTLTKLCAVAAVDATLRLLGSALRVNRTLRNLIVTDISENRVPSLSAAAVHELAAGLATNISLRSFLFQIHGDVAAAGKSGAQRIVRCGRDPLNGALAALRACRSDTRSVRVGVSGNF